MTLTIDDRCKNLVQDLQLGQPEDVTNVVPLTGGVASDIARFDLNGQTLCAKFALEKLKVVEDWTAPLHRNAAEYAWLQFAAETYPQGAVKLFGRSQTQHGFAMEFVDGPDVYLWKAALLASAPDKGEAAQVGRFLGMLQAASARPDFDRGAFNNRDDFRALRIEPYLTFTAGRHPDLEAPLNDLAEMLYQADQVLVHGDVSPKNIMFRASDPIFLDAECATMGDASFDPAFCLNHLVLKAFHLPDSRETLLTNIESFWGAYVPSLDFGNPSEIERRITRLLPALMLARIDGKSPVEYLSDDNRCHVRAVAVGLIESPEDRISQLLTRLRDSFL
ncbi:aminoglycoside phosphotransferase family protein [Ruegeria sp. HKCCD7255]|uniref:phosphotransferase n=1 Tax=Ruegeria sp. HKCCD7255 TaxID=2683004 RepID=UPI0014887186